MPVRKIVGFLVGFIVSMLVTVAVAVKQNLVVTGPVWLLVWGGAGACCSWGALHLPWFRRSVPPSSS